MNHFSHKIIAFSLLTAPIALFLSGCSSECTDCIEAAKYLDMPQDDGSLNCLYFGDFEKFVYSAPGGAQCPETLLVKKEALQYKSIAGLIMIDDSFVATKKSHFRQK